MSLTEALELIVQRGSVVMSPKYPRYGCYWTLLVIILVTPLVYADVDLPCQQKKYYSASGYSPRENICLNGFWDALENPDCEEDPDNDLRLVWPIRTDIAWKKCILPQNVNHVPGEFSPQSDESLWDNPQKSPDKAWFRRTFFLPANWAGKRVLFRSGGVNYDSVIYVNGAYAGRHRNQLPYVIDVTEHVRYGQENELYLGYIDYMMTLSENGFLLEPGGKFLPRITGPYGDIYLEAVGALYIDDVDIITRWRNKELELLVDYSNPGSVNDIEIEATVHDDERSVGSITVAAADLADKQNGTVRIKTFLDDVRPWHPEDPFLYTLKVRVVSGNRCLDSWRRDFGFREFTTRDGRFFLNGKAIRLQGTSHLVSRAAQQFSPDYIRSYYRALKAINLNTCRLHGMPFPTVWLEVADEEGMLIISEGMFTGGPWGKKTRAAYYDFESRWSCFAEYYREWITRDRWHPCVIMWSAYNEPQNNTPTSNIYNIIRRHDGNKRPVYCDGHPEIWDDGNSDIITVHYPASPLAFPYWPDDFYFLEYGPTSEEILTRWNTCPWYSPYVSTKSHSGISYHHDLALRQQLFRELSAQAYEDRWALGEEDAKRPLSFGEANATWWYCMNNVSRFIGSAAYRGLYDHNGSLWEALGRFESQAIDSYRYMGVNHYCGPWHPVYFSYATIYNPDGSEIVWEQKERAGLDKPGYHPYRMTHGYGKVNPGWSEKAPETVLTAAGAQLRRAYQPVRILVKPHCASYFDDETLSREFAVDNIGYEDKKLKLKITLAEKTILEKEYFLAPDEIIRDRLSVLLDGISMGVHSLQFALVDSENALVDTHVSRLRIAERILSIDAPALAVFDPNGQTLAVLSRCGAKCTRIAELGSLEGVDSRVLVVGEDALDGQEDLNSNVREWLAKGNDVIIFAQRDLENMQGLFAEEISSVSLPNAKAFIRSPSHPIARGLTDDDLMLWGDDHMVTAKSMYPKGFGNVRIVADQGDRSGLVYPVIAEFSNGGGRIIVIQCLCISKFDESPPAQLIVKNALSYLADTVYNLRPCKTNSSYAMLEELNACQSHDSDSVALGPDDKLNAQIISSVQDGGVLWISGLDAERLDVVSRCLGNLETKKTQANHPQLELGIANKLTDGIAGWELFINEKRPVTDTVIDLSGSSPKWKPVLVEPKYTVGKKFGAVYPATAHSIPYQIFDRYRRRITQPGAAMVAMDHGEGVVIIDTIDWQRLIEHESVQIFLKKFFTNLGIRISSECAQSVGVVSGLWTQEYEAVFRVDCGAEEGKTYERVMVSDQGIEEKEYVTISFVDEYGNEWLADRPWSRDQGYGFVRGRQCVSDEKVNSSLHAVGKSQRCEDMDYRFTVKNGTYLVRIIICKADDAKGAEYGFDIIAEGNLLDSNSRCSGKESLLFVESPIEVLDGELDIEFRGGAIEPIVSGIEVLSY